jgi:hypothetical protein
LGIGEGDDERGTMSAARKVRIVYRLRGLQRRTSVRSVSSP